MHRLWLDEGAGALSLIKVLARPEQALRASQAEQNSPLPTLLWRVHTHQATKHSQDRDRALQTSRRNASRRAVGLRTLRSGVPRERRPSEVGLKTLGLVFDRGWLTLGFLQRRRDNSGGPLATC